MSSGKNTQMWSPALQQPSTNANPPPSAKASRSSPAPAPPNIESETTFPPLGASRRMLDWAEDAENSPPWALDDVASLKKRVEELETDVADRDGEIAELSNELDQTKSAAAEEVAYIQRKHHEFLDSISVGMDRVKVLEKEDSRLRNEVKFLRAKVVEYIPQYNEEEGQGDSTEVDSAVPTAAEDQSSDDVGSAVLPEDKKPQAEEESERGSVTLSSPSVEPDNKKDVVSAESKENYASATNEQSPTSPFSNADFPALSPNTTTNFGPVFVTRDTIKKSTPVPPPKKLTMGIDLSKFGKKPAPIPTVSPTSPRQGSKSFAPIVVDPSKDMRTMTVEQRFRLGNSRKVTVKLDSEPVGVVPMTMFMQCSRLANDYFTKNPLPDAMDFPEGSMTKAAAKTHVEWMRQHCHIQRVWSIRFSGDGQTDRNNFEVIRAARVMGLHNMYVGHFTRHYCENIRNSKKFYSYEFMALVDEFAVPGNDPILDCLVANLRAFRNINAIPNVSEFREFLEQCKVLSSRFDMPKKKNGGDRKNESGDKDKGKKKKQDSPSA
ncbi:unnamed protein product [Periconia digitata]|uniref:Uncharacterized protein n=1 Tax=Periconia digitata TaxID=1303443 RepID=A0A9W4UC93_9PLEO|nr:unnamed protein product [Periconia digitata]